MTREFLFFFTLAASPLLASDSIPSAAQNHAIAIVGATIHPVSGPQILNGTLVFEHGKITLVSNSATAPSGVEVIHAEGKHVYPGFMIPYTNIGLLEIDQASTTNDTTEVGTNNPNVRADTAFNPDSEQIPVLRANGITSGVVTPNGPLIEGLSAVMLMDGWTNGDMTVKAPAALNIYWPSMINAGPKKKELDKERDDALKELDDVFAKARAYRVAKLAQVKKGIPYHDADLRLESMIPVLEGTIPLVVWASELRQIESAVAFASREKLRLIIGGGEDTWRAAELLKKNDVAVLAGPIYGFPSRRFDEYDSPLTLPLKLSQAGIRYAIICPSESIGRDRNLPYEAAMAAANGLPKDEALKAITLYPAQIFGVADRMGSLEIGKDATLIVTTGDPLEVRSQVMMEYIQGKKVDLSNKQTRLYEKYKGKYKKP